MTPLSQPADTQQDAPDAPIKPPGPSLSSEGPGVQGPRCGQGVLCALASRHPAYFQHPKLPLREELPLVFEGGIHFFNQIVRGEGFFSKVKFLIRKAQVWGVAETEFSRW